MVELIIQFYEVNYDNVDKDKIRRRQDEITYCLKSNLQNSSVDRVHFLYDKQSDVDFMEKEGVSKDHSKLTVFDIGRRMHYSDVFSYANTYLKDKICVYLHADMCIYSGFDQLNHMDTTKIYALTAHNFNCNKQPICHCTRQFKTHKGFYGPTFDGFVFSSPIKDAVIKDGTHYVGMMGSENRLICILKENGYDVICANNILFCYHHHIIKVFSSARGKWINRAGEMKDLEYYSSIHRAQTDKTWEEKIVGGGIPFFDGTCKFTERL